MTYPPTTREGTTMKTDNTTPHLIYDPKQVNQAMKDARAALFAYLADGLNRPTKVFPTRPHRAIAWATQTNRIESATCEVQVDPGDWPLIVRITAGAPRSGLDASFRWWRRRSGLADYTPTTAGSWTLELTCLPHEVAALAPFVCGLVRYRESGDTSCLVEPAVALEPWNSGSVHEARYIWSVAALDYYPSRRRCA